MVHHYFKRGKRLANRIFSVCLALMLICSIALPAYASALEGGAEKGGKPVTVVSETVETSGQVVPEEKQKEPETEDDLTETKKQEGTEDSIQKDEQSPAKDADSSVKTDVSTITETTENTEITEETKTTEETQNAGTSKEESADITDAAGADTPEVSDDGINATALEDAREITGSNTVVEGETVTLTGTNGYSHSWSVSDGTGSAQIVGSANGQTVTVQGVAAGSVMIRHAYRESRRGQQITETYTLNVTAASGTIKVYVYVAGSGYSQECLELLGIDAGTLDGNGYFPVGEIELDRSFLSGKANAATPGAPLINSTADWQAVLAALGKLNTSTLVNQDGKPYANNQNNNVDDYLSQASGDVGCGWGSQQTALFYWNYWENKSFGFNDQTVRYHLDLLFNTKKITFITGNNGITSGSAKDGTTVDTRTYITGSTIQEPRNLTIPEGYKFVGYYTDANFTTPWNGIGTPLNEDQTVYIKITPLDNVIIYYKNVTGEDTGSLSRDSEGLNPVTGEAQGSVATAKDGYEFDGWYADEGCTQLITKEENYKPLKPQGEWVDGTTYYARFVPKTRDITVKKLVAGGLGDTSKKFAFFYSYADPADSTKTVTGSFSLSHNGTETITGVPVGAKLTITENNGDYSVSAAYGGSDVQVEYTDDNKTTASMQITVNESDTEITVTNLKDVNPDTGIWMDSLPYVMVLLLMLAAAAAFVICKYKRHNA